jgi:hypothetical protein
MSEEQQEVVEESNDMPSDWYEAIPEGLKDAPFFKPKKDGGIRTVEEVRAALDNAAKLQGNLAESHIKIPSPDDADADIAAARERALKSIPGLREVSEGEDTPPPESPDGYKVPELEGFNPDESSLADVAAFAHEHGWGQKQFDDYVIRLASEQSAGLEKRESWLMEQQKVITDQLGRAKDEHLNRTIAAIQDYAPEGFVDSLRAGDMDAGVVLMLDGLVHKMIEMGGESTQFVQQANAGAKVLTPGEHREKANDIWRKLQELPAHDPDFKRLSAKRMEHIAMAMQH